MGKGAKLSTYAGFWIRQCLTRALSNDSRTIRIPTNLAQTRSAISKFTDKYMLKNGREPKDEEIQEKFDITQRQLRRIRSHNHSYISLDKKVGMENDEESSTFGNLITDKSQKNPLEILTDVNTNENIEEALLCLKDRERVILELRFGLNNNDNHTLESIGDQFNLTRERIRQIEKAALQKMRTLMIDKNKIKRLI